MLAVVSPVYCDPAGYQVSNIDQPEITEPDDVIIKVHAASINPVDVKVAAGAFKLALPHTCAYTVLLCYSECHDPN